VETLLVSNERAALIGNIEGQVHTKIRSAELSEEEWGVRLSSYFRPKHWLEDEEGAPDTSRPGPYRHPESGRPMIGWFNGVKLYENFSDRTFGLSIRATFLPHVKEWVIADLSKND